MSRRLCILSGASRTGGIADRYLYRRLRIPRRSKCALRTGSDTAQRMALMRSGRYRVWSLTWDDVQEQFRFPVPRFDAELVSPGAKFGPLVGNLDPTGAGIWKSVGSLSSFGALMLLLGAARRRSWPNYAQAFAISLLENVPDKPGTLRLRCHRNHSDGSPLLRLEGEMRVADLQSRSFEALFLRLHLFDDYAHHGALPSGRGHGVNSCALGISYSSSFALIL